MVNPESLVQMNESQLRDTVRVLMNQVAHHQQALAEYAEIVATLDHEIAQRDRTLAAKDQLIRWKEQRIMLLTHEMAVLKRWKFGRSREGLNAEQLPLFDETIDADMAAIEMELDALRQGSDAIKPRAPRQPRRAPLPPELPRTEFRHEPESTRCTNAGCTAPLQRIGEDVTEKLDYTPGVFSVERHVRGKWVCRCCDTLVQAPVPAHVIDKGIPTEGLLAQVPVAKYADHLPLARREKIFARAVCHWHARLWRSGSVNAVYSCSRWWMRCALRYWRARYCTLMRRRYRCSSPVRVRPIGHISGPTPQVASSRYGR